MVEEQGLKLCYIFKILSKGLPQDFGNRDFKVPAEVPCIVESLCNRHQGTITLDFFFLFILLQLSMESTLFIL